MFVLFMMKSGPTTSRGRFWVLVSEGLRVLGSADRKYIFSGRWASPVPDTDGTAGVRKVSEISARKGWNATQSAGV